MKRKSLAVPFGRERKKEEACPRRPPLPAHPLVLPYTNLAGEGRRVACTCGLTTYYPGGTHCKILGNLRLHFAILC